ncbi:Zinc finger C2H2-type,Zinc finger, RING/FYVE/PHD-type [Cinara cedri]|uniref:Zinc finger C2H2-type,Zinc finger, RING/FYVE/PHD-type n=1 Tax=Cinara cedri TaxID=506608 RepID=A0A5E4N9V6_9HEMI|nr:Zinc finger C2H2-type,Zinc finger, RING/FYVE/PHD-type [Cinara cedri]
MTRHAKAHEGVKFLCALCPKMFSRKDKWATHVKIVHHEGRVTAPAFTSQAGPSTAPQNTVAPKPVASPSKTQWTTDEEDDKLFMDFDMDIDNSKFFLFYPAT